MPRSIFAGLLAIALLGVGVPARAQVLDPAGIWLTQDKDARIRISRCGPGICGVIIWLRDPLDEGKPSLDKNNPNPARRKRPLVGLSLFQSMKPAGVNKWSGHIYNSDNGKTYEGGVTVVDRGNLKIEGCDGPLCGAELWTRVQ